MRLLLTALAVVALVLPTTSRAAIPDADLEGCDTLDADALREVIELETSGLDLEAKSVEVTCSGSERVAIKVTVASQALFREVELGEVRDEDRPRLVGLNAVEMIDILQLHEEGPEPVDTTPKPVRFDSVLVLAEPHEPPPAPFVESWGVGGGALGQYHLGFAEPFAGIAIDVALRTRDDVGARLDVQVAFQSVGLETELSNDSARVITASSGLTGLWWATRWLGIGPGFRFGGIFASRESTGRSAGAYWGGLFAAALASFEMFRGVQLEFGLEAGFSPWTYTISADEEEEVAMNGLFTAATFGVGWQ